MAPEFPPRLIVFTLEAVDGALTASIENVEPRQPAPGAPPLRVKWSELAAYWCLRGDDIGRTSVEWALHAISGPLELEVRYLNSHSSLDTVPASAGIEIDAMGATSPTVVRVFLCHASDDKSSVRELHARLKEAGFNPWLDESDILPGEDWQRAITAAVKNSHVVVVCLSQRSVKKVGYLQREIRSVLQVAEEQPEGRSLSSP
jgi:hypothetical protein